MPSSHLPTKEDVISELYRLKTMRIENGFPAMNEAIALKVLGIARADSIKTKNDLKKVYLSLTIKIHPDKFVDSPHYILATECMQFVNNARDFLVDCLTRRVSDELNMQEEFSGSESNANSADDLDHESYLKLIYCAAFLNEGQITLTHAKYILGFDKLEVVSSQACEASYERLKKIINDADLFLEEKQTLLAIANRANALLMTHPDTAQLKQLTDKIFQCVGIERNTYNQTDIAQILHHHATTESILSIAHKLYVENNDSLSVEQVNKVYNEMRATIEKAIRHSKHTEDKKVLVSLNLLLINARDCSLNSMEKASYDFIVSVYKASLETDKNSVNAIINAGLKLGLNPDHEKIIKIKMELIFNNLKASTRNMLMQNGITVEIITEKFIGMTRSLSDTDLHKTSQSNREYLLYMDEAECVMIMLDATDEPPMNLRLEGKLNQLDVNTIPRINSLMSDWGYSDIVVSERVYQDLQQAELLDKIDYAIGTYHRTPPARSRP